MMPLSRLALIALLLASAPAAAEPGAIRAGVAEVVDGDSLRIDGVAIRLNGVDALEAAQTCGGRACGQEATQALRRLVAAQPGGLVICIERTKDRWQRVVATCRANGLDLGAGMVLAGYAKAFRRYSNEYVFEETAAMQARAGAWAYGFPDPTDFRAGLGEGAAATSFVASPAARVASAPPEQRSGCMIKGNINSRGDRIYHTPSSRSYSRTIAERMFCTEAEAQAAGFRAPRG